MILSFWGGDNFPEKRTFTNNDWSPSDVEKELRAQIELATKNIPDISHMTFHMGGTSVSPKINEIHDRLAEEYDLITSVEIYGVKRFRGYNGAKTLDEKISNLVAGLKNLKPGTYLFVDHPAYDTPEMQATGHQGSYEVAVDREGVTKAWIDEKVLEVIVERGIKLISYADLR
jgi:hypothetical protein